MPCVNLTMQECCVVRNKRDFGCWLSDIVDLHDIGQFWTTPGTPDRRKPEVPDAAGFARAAGRRRDSGVSPWQNAIGATIGFRVWGRFECRAGHHVFWIAFGQVLSVKASHDQCCARVGVLWSMICKMCTVFVFPCFGMSVCGSFWMCV